MTQNLNKISVCAIVVSYNPSIEKLREIFCALNTQVSQIIVVDNGSDIETIRFLHLRDDIVLIELGKNFGIATAHNKGIMWANEQNYSYVLLMDHDSVPMPNMVLYLVNTMTELLAQNIQVAALGTRYRDPITKHSSSFLRFGFLKFKKIFCKSIKTVIAVDLLISSGSLIPVKVLKEIGLMDEQLFIDHVDTEWFIRAKHKGYHSFGVCEAVMTHRLGERRYKLWLGYWRYVPLHSPLRCYYQFRNSILLYKRNYMPLRWKINDIVLLFSLASFYLIFVPRRTTYLAMFIKGIWHGIINKVGHHEQQFPPKK